MSSHQSYEGPLVLTRVMEERAKTLGDRTALFGRWGSLTYEELWRDSLRLATLMDNLGVERGDRVANALDASPESLKVIIAAAILGAVEVPIQSSMRGVPLENILRSAAPRFYVLDGETREPAEDACDAVGLQPRTIWSGGQSTDMAVDAHIADASDLGEFPVNHSDERDPLWIMFTSGTTGPSKGVLHTNRSGLRNALTAAGVANLSGKDVAYSFFTFAHITARTFVIFATMLTGGSVWLRRRLSISSFWDDVTEGGVTWFPAMGSVLSMLESSASTDAQNSLRLICAGGITMDQKLHFEDSLGVNILDVYGLTETGTVASQQPQRSRRMSVGSVLPHFEVQIQDADGYAVPKGQVGEICVRTNEPNSIFAGYWGRPVDTLECWRDLWFHTGDSGRFDEEGDLVFVDRYKDMIRRRGENISSHEVQAAVLRIPGVHECAAFPLPVSEVDEEVMVAVVADPFVTPESVTAACESSLPKHAVPRYIRFVDELPKTASQRVQKQQLRAEGAVTGTWDRERGTALEA